MAPLKVTYIPTALDTSPTDSRTFLRLTYLLIGIIYTPSDRKQYVVVQCHQTVYYSGLKTIIGVHFISLGDPQGHIECTMIAV